MPGVVFIGVDLQRDWIEPEGAIPVPGAERVVEAAVKLRRHAVDAGLRIVFTQDTHADDDPIFESFPPHCVDGTPGHDLVPALELGDAPVIGEAFDATPELEPGRPAVIRAHDHRQGIFANINADRLIGSAGLEAEEETEYVVFGLPIDVGIRGAVQGLRARHRTTIVVSDAVAALDPDRSSDLLAAMAGTGCHFLTLDKVLERYT